MKIFKFWQVLIGRIRNCLEVGFDPRNGIYFFVTILEHSNLVFRTRVVRTVLPIIRQKKLVLDPVRKVMTVTVYTARLRC